MRRTLGRTMRRLSGSALTDSSTLSPATRTSPLGPQTSTRACEFWKYLVIAFVRNLENIIDLADQAHPFYYLAGFLWGCRSSPSRFASCRPACDMRTWISVFGCQGKTVKLNNRKPAVGLCCSTPFLASTVREFQCQPFGSCQSGSALES